jgi:hypothetical protein
MPDPDTSALRDRLEKMEAKIDRLERRLKREASQTLVAARTLAERDNSYPDTYDGLVKLMDRRGVPRRLASGAKKPSGSRAQTYVSLTELEAGEELGTQSVQRDGGLM